MWPAIAGSWAPTRLALPALSNTLRKELIDPGIAAHGGRVVTLIGDGILIEFASALDAVAYAVEIQRAGQAVPQRQRH